MARQRTLRLTRRTVTDLRASLPQVADRTVSAITDEVPSYSEAFTGHMGETIRGAVELALGGFLSLAERSRGAEQSPTAVAADGAYQLGRGEARSGRSVDALLSAYRIGARVAWREMSTTAVAAGLDAENVGRFAELVFAYIDELSAASVAGHGDERETTGRVRQRLLERLAAQLLAGADAEAVERAAEEAGWPVPETLTAVLVPDSQARAVLASLPPETLQVAEPVEVHGEEGLAVLLVPDVHEHRRGALLRALEHRSAVAGPARPWPAVGASLARAVRVRELGRGPDSEAHLAELVLCADAVALEDLRARVLAPLRELRPGSAEKLVETLRSWLLHQGRRDAVAADLFVHAQTVRYRMTQVREVLGDRLDDPVAVLELTVALGTLDPEAWAAETADDAG
ncbi:transcriptional regulator [Marmoricola sp. Leaf446]|uniref:PucR family transcriptional regulator n=1 Tax=Marmoricola sp. Leaf446 TaxID=1736379 RepID=UPI0006FE6D64|nr:helix-turn-helix domain-containing protein [Marmoricola sp. Leaf446]KQT92214.1 transcriptional regulator [Marmoricola sp. Leaf446]